MSIDDSAIGEPIGSPAQSSLWTNRRLRLRAALSQHDELFADLYGRAIDALSEQPRTRGSLVVAGHCMRDLINGLPDVLADVEGVLEYSDLTGPARELSEVWERNEGVLGRADSAMESEAQSETTVDARMTVPTALVEAARKVVLANHRAAMNNLRRQSALVLGRVEVRNDPTVKLFRDSVRVFEKLRHPQRGREVRLEDSDKIERALEIIESALVGRLGSFFETVQDLQDVLDAANERVGEDSQ
jgi:hypothetical protein